MPGAPTDPAPNDPDTAIRFFNRYTDEIEEEAIYGESFLRWAYGTPLGRASVWALARRPVFSKFYGWRMNRPASRDRVAPFIKEFGLEPDDFADAVDSFGSFNAFFSRRLKPTARPVDSVDDDGVAVFPADGRHLAIPVLGAETGFFVKGQRIDVGKLLGDDSDLLRRFEGGTLVLSRLCPVDYHRFHFPVAGTPSAPVVHGGPLYSVSPLALRRRLAYLWENARTLVQIESDRFGSVMSIDIGATCVGSIVHTFTPNEPMAKADERGYFEFGGSSTITLFKPGAIELEADLLEHSADFLEVYARMGDRMGRACQ